ncbi:MAG TPA: hypothetical protein PLS90_09995 [Candidatus Sumerlaeota bacterium]|nr:hypothetical protein [Candidatus Sumerlaeota bacterium]HPK02773.1 hypothetical protein [Candidatus Sumerlaeota bacterium]
MIYSGRVRNNVIVLEDGVVLPEGTPVKIEVHEPAPAPAPPGSTLLDRLGDLVGSVKGLPSDFAHNHDHYIHGTPKR